MSTSVAAHRLRVMGAGPQRNVLRHLRCVAVIWNNFVICSNDAASDWAVVGGVWTCNECGKQMTVTEIARYHATLA